jgi:hypothetical protein
MFARLKDGTSKGRTHAFKVQVGCVLVSSIDEFCCHPIMNVLLAFMLVINIEYVNVGCVLVLNIDVFCCHPIMNVSGILNEHHKQTSSPCNKTCLPMRVAPRQYAG